MSQKRWSAIRPKALVIACSDGRLQESVDDFLENHLGITYYDRLYAPGGPGALASSGYEILRSEQFRRECLFLIQAHDVEEIILLFHGGAEGGPDEATCADYRRKLPGRTPAQISGQQETDLGDILLSVFGGQRGLRLHVYRAQVTGEGLVRFVDLAGSL